MSVLRSVSPIHIEYLQNMGVGASMSVSILRDGKLWGLFACHHYAPHNVPFERRTAAELFGQMFSLLMESRERDSEAAYEARAAQAAQPARHGDGGGSDPLRQHRLASRRDCRPPRLRRHRRMDRWQCHLAGHGADAGAVRRPDRPSGSHATCAMFWPVHEIAAEYPPGRDFADRAAGMLVVPLSRPARDFLVFFRKEACAFGELGGRSQQAGHRRSARRAPHAAQELRAVARDGERPVDPVAAGRRAHRREPAGQPARGHPASLRHHRGRAPAGAGAAGAADRRAQPPGPQHPGPDPRRHLAEPRSVAHGRCLHRGGRRAHPGAGARPRPDHRRQLGAGLVPRPRRRPRPAPISAARPRACACRARRCCWSRRASRPWRWSSTS